MKKETVDKTRKLNLCLSCEACRAVCPTGAIKIKFLNGYFQPQIDKEKCIHCGLCSDICPGIDVDPGNIRRVRNVRAESFDGPILESYVGYVKNNSIRNKTASGGFITTLIINLIKDKHFDGAFVLPFDSFESKPAQLKLINDIEEIIKAAQSKYIPSSIYEVIRAISKKDGRKYIIIGTGCQFSTIKKYLKINKIGEENLLFLGLFCDRTLNFNIIKYFEDKYRIGSERLLKIYFRTKEKFGWPGNIKLIFDSDREIIVDRVIRKKLKKYFQVYRCLFCTDRLNRTADISFGDSYIIGEEDPRGKSVVVVRTKKGKYILDLYSDNFILKSENPKEIRRAQDLADKKENLEYAKVLIRDNNLYGEGGTFKSIEPYRRFRLWKIKRYISLGERYRFYKIEAALFITKILKKIRKVKKWLPILIKVSIIVIYDLIISSGKDNIDNSKKNIIITGSNFNNKGSQAMTFTSVDQIRRRFPDKNIYILSSLVSNIRKEELNNYNFKVSGWDINHQLSTLIPSFGSINKRTKPLGIKEIIKNASFFVDISGYSLSSDWPLYNSLNWLLNLIIAKRYNVPLFVFPQSIGPFNYPTIYNKFLNLLIKLYINYPQVIITREESGRIYLKKLTDRKISKAHDLVLQYPDLELPNIFNDSKTLRNIKIQSNSVGIIPNINVVERSGSPKILMVYKDIISNLLRMDKNVYIFAYSRAGMEICYTLKKYFSEDDRVILLWENLSAIEWEWIVSQFQFVVASRYHSIIHAYKNGVPALVMGWAEKYYELLKDFDQLEYFVDCKKEIDLDDITGKLHAIARGYKKEKNKIDPRAEKIKKEDVFSFI